MRVAGAVAGWRDGSDHRGCLERDSVYKPTYTIQPPRRAEPTPFTTRVAASTSEPRGFICQQPRFSIVKLTGNSHIFCKVFLRSPAFGDSCIQQKEQRSWVSRFVLTEGIYYKVPLVADTQLDRKEIYTFQTDRIETCLLLDRLQLRRLSALSRVDPVQRTHWTGIVTLPGVTLFHE
ncbi:hypothetical protein J6590_007116 [Homalodisca vitripennis]|nr:hypothetical protein J6590_007116 [Homalodisca vitripennis]